jgi:hypothetical protein
MPGWLAKGTVVSRKGCTDLKFKTPFIQESDETLMRPIDRIRDFLWRRKITVTRWWRGKRARKAVPRPLLRKAIREFGGEPLKTDGTRELQVKLLKILGSLLPSTSQEGSKMAAKKRAAKKTARKAAKPTRSRKQAVDDEDDEELEDEEEYEDQEDEEDDDEDLEEEDDEDDEDEEEERPRRRSGKTKKSSKKSSRRAASNGTRRSLLSSVGNQVLTFGKAVRMDPEHTKLARKMEADRPLSVRQYDKLVEHLRERRDATKKLRGSDAAGLKKALRGVRMCAAKAE